jgi:hypothetical protein
LPAVVTHSFFADEVLDRIGSSRLKNEIRVRRNLFRLGAQGPDLFFYYKAAPWIPYDGIEKLGNIIHEEKVDSFYSKSFQYLKGMEDKKGFFDLAAYIAGYLCHFSLDRTAHPFIHYTSGIDNFRNRISWKYHIYHRVLESALDYLILEKNGIDPRRFKSYEMIMVDPCRIKPVLEYYEHTLPAVYGIHIKRAQTKEVIKGIYRVLRYLYDPRGIKYYSYRMLELFMGKPGGITSSMMPRSIDRKLDYLNLSRSTWLHPCSRKIRSRESFWEIYERALVEAVELTGLFALFVDSGKYPSKLISMIGNISYSSGMECSSPEKLIYFDSIFEKRNQPS